MLGCEDYPSLYERQIAKIRAEFEPNFGEYNASRNEFRLHQHFGGGVIALRNLDDASKYMSAEFAGMGIDELTKNSERTFHVLRGSLRWPGIDNTFFAAATNPAANWVRDYWIEKRYPKELDPERDKFAFVPALPKDNPNLPQSYWDMLATLPGALREAWLLGNWYAATEGLVYENFSADNLTDKEPDKELSYELALDDGYIDPRATLFIQRTGAEILVFDELYQTKRLPEETIADIKAKMAEHGLPLPELAAVSHEAVELQRRLREADIVARSWLASKGGAKSPRLEAITLTRQLICDGKGVRSIKIHRRCKHLLDEISAGYKYPEGAKSTTEKPVDGNDHAVQALEGWCWLRARR